VHERVVAGVSAAAAAIGLAPHGMTPSPITGATGNQEYLLHLRSAGSGHTGEATERST
jgi:predicted rRNA methylase YqxC with S4 and FtsJ domains